MEKRKKRVFLKKRAFPPFSKRKLSVIIKGSICDKTNETERMRRMAIKKNEAQQYNDQSIKALKGADRVRKRPSVIFGSDGLEGFYGGFVELSYLCLVKSTCGK